MNTCSTANIIYTKCANIRELEIVIHVHPSLLRTSDHVLAIQRLVFH